MRPLGGPAPRGRWLVVLWLGYWAGLFALTHLPKLGRAPSPIPHSDKLVHFGLFFGLTILGHLACTRRSAPSARKTLGWSAVYLVYGALDEWLQQFVGRTPDIADWLADGAGVIAATLLVLWRQSTKDAS